MFVAEEGDSLIVFWIDSNSILFFIKRDSR